MNTTDLEKKEMELRRSLREVEDQKKSARRNMYLEKYGMNWNCNGCRYSVRVSVGAGHTYCIKDNCIYCSKECYDFKPKNNISEFLNEYGDYYNDENMSLCEEIVDVPEDKFEDVKEFILLFEKIFGHKI